MKRYYKKSTFEKCCEHPYQIIDGIRVVHDTNIPEDMIIVPQTDENGCHKTHLIITNLQKGKRRVKPVV